MSLEECLVHLPKALKFLNEGRGFNCDEFPSLNTTEPLIEVWWNSLDSTSKIDVGRAAVHFGLMTPRYKWICEEQYGVCTNFETLSKSQKRIIKCVFSRRNEPYSVIDLSAIFKL